MHSIKDLEFKPSPTKVETEEAVLTLRNGYTVKILKGKMAAHTYGAPYELFISPIIKEITVDSIGYLSEKELISLINEIETFPKLKSYTWKFRELRIQTFPNWDW